MKTNSIIILIVLMLTYSCGNSKNETNNQENNHSNQSNMDENDFGLKEALNHYYHLKDALVRSEAAEASNGAQAMYNVLDTVEITNEENRTHIDGLLATIKNDLQNISATGDLEKQREYFEPVSDNFYELLKTTGVSGETVYRQYCPMAFDDKGAYWLSSEKEIRNPYFGDVMLKCGSVKETLN
jgi:membrane fusion protein, copper/silver efflux system